MICGGPPFAVFNSLFGKYSPRSFFIVFRCWCKNNGGGTKKGKITPQEERRLLIQKRKLLAAKRDGAEFSSDSKVVGPTETLLKLIAGRRKYVSTEGSNGEAAASTSSSSYPYFYTASWQDH